MATDLGTHGIARLRSIQTYLQDSLQVKLFNLYSINAMLIFETIHRSTMPNCSLTQELKGSRPISKAGQICEDHDQGLTSLKEKTLNGRALKNAAHRSSALQFSASLCAFLTHILPRCI